MAASEVTPPEQVAVQRFEAGESEIAIFEFQGTLRDLMVSSMRSGYLTTGNYLSDAKAVSPQGVMSMAVSGAALGGTALSASLSSSLYMATADPSSLMKLGRGVGSAVMGATGITGQAPFIPIASSIPVVAPLMAMQAMTTAVTLRQFQKVDQKLDAIKDKLNAAIARTEATHVGELLTASKVVDEVGQIYDQEGSFSGDMLARLALAERDVGTLAERSRFLVESHALEAGARAEDVERANYDAYSAMLASFVDLKIAYLRVCVDLQEHPRSVETSVERLKLKIGNDLVFWEALLSQSDRLKEAIAARTRDLADMSKAKRLLPGAVGGAGTTEKEIKALNDAYTTTIVSEKNLLKGFDSLIESAKQTLETLKHPLTGPSTPTLVYWRDDDGEHSFYSSHLRLA